MKKVAMILSGCGFLDGTEIYEATFSILALKQKGHAVSLFAPDKPATAIVNHLDKKVAAEKRSVLAESARIARGEIEPLSALKQKDFDALFLPGGFGVAINLSNFVELKEKCDVDPEFKQIVLDFHQHQKPILATCISPAILGRIFENIAAVKMTLGSTDDDQALLQKMGMDSVSCTISEICKDDQNQVYTTPCFMEPENLPQMFLAIEKLVEVLG